MNVRLNFVRQQGFADASAASCSVQYPALMWQPRVILVLVLLGMLFETGWYFVVFAGVLAWNALVPAWNPFDAVYNRFLARRHGTPPLSPAPGPRRFSQGLAGALMLAVGVAMITGRLDLAWTLQVILLIAIGLLVFGRLCLGSYLFLLLTGKASFANRTLPWARGGRS